MNSAPPKIPGSPTPFWIGGAVLVAAALSLAGVVFFFNPATYGFYPVCQFHRLTGLNCPGCGMTRAVYALLHGQVLAAWRDNALLVSGMGLLMVRGGWMALKKLCGRPTGEFLPEKFFWLLMGVALIFTVLRNLPGLAFLSP